MADPISLLTKTYCLYSLLCFGNELTNQEDCVKNCRCFFAPLDSINDRNSLSFVCSTVQILDDQKFLDKETDFEQIFNTLVLDVRDNNNNFQSEQNQHQKELILARNLVLQGFVGTLRETGQDGKLLPTIFERFDPEIIEIMQIIKWTNAINPFDTISFRFDLFNDFHALQVLNFDQCIMEIIDGSFAKVQLPELHTLSITNSRLEYIDHGALNGGKAKTLRRLNLNNNLLTNLKFILNAEQNFEQLWHLDVSHNRIRYLSSKLIEKLPNLRTFYLNGNNFKWLPLTAVRPWFEIREFRLAQSGQQTQSERSNILYLNEDMKWITKMNDQSISSMHLINSLVNVFQYCSDIGLNSYSEIIDNLDKIRIFNQRLIPDQLTIEDGPSSAKMVDKIHCERKDDWQQDAPVFVVGQDLQYSPNWIEWASFFGSRNIWKNSLSKSGSTSSQKLVFRFPLFDSKMFNLFQTGSGLDPDHIELFTDLVEELLDLAYLNKQYVLLKMWPSTLLEGQIPATKYGRTFMKIVLKPLAQKIQDHPALMGVEITDQAFGVTLENHFDQDLDASANDCPYKDKILTLINSEMEFLSENFKIIRKTFGEELKIGIGFDAKCKPCMPLLLIDDCFPDSGSPDFLTIQSTYPDDKGEAWYSHAKLEKSFETWFKQDERMDLISKKHLFYSFHSTTNTINVAPKIQTVLKKVTLGYFTPSDYSPQNFLKTNMNITMV